MATGGVPKARPAHSRRRPPPKTRAEAQETSGTWRESSVLGRPTARLDRGRAYADVGNIRVRPTRRPSFTAVCTICVRRQKVRRRPAQRIVEACCRIRPSNSSLTRTKRPPPVARAAKRNAARSWPGVVAAWICIRRQHHEE